MKYSEKINLPCDWQSFLRNGPVLGKHGNNIYYPIERVIRRYIPRKQMKMIADLLPESLQDKVIGVNCAEIRLLYPHIHLKEQTVINFYQETGEEVTSFWEGDIVSDDRWSIDNGNGYINVNHELLTPVESFVAKAGDVRILNSRQPHSVTYSNDERLDGLQFIPKNDSVRIVIQAFFDTPYAEVLYELKKAGLVID